MHNIEVSLLSFNKDKSLSYISNIKKYTGDFFYEGKKYNLEFDDGEQISFKPDGELQDYSINNSKDRYNKIFADRLNNIEEKQKRLEEEQKVITRRDICFIVAYIGISVILFIGVIWWHPTFPNSITLEQDKYKILYEIFRKSPTIIMAIVGFKFLQLAFERIRIIGEVEKVNKFIKLTDDKNIKNKLLEKIAIPFFSPKKIKNVFFEKLIDDISIDTKNTDKK